MKTILLIVKIILLIVGLETGYAERSRIFVQASAESNLFGLCRAQPKMSRNRACSYCRAQPKISKKRSRKVRVYEPMSGQDKPVISDGFEMQTIHSQPVWLQSVMRISAGLKGFSGKIKRNARARGLITAFPKARPNASLHYCGKSTRTCQNHVRPHPHQARPYQPNKGDARHGRGAPCRSWHLPALETYLHGSFLFFSAYSVKLSYEKE